MPWRSRRALPTCFLVLCSFQSARAGDALSWAAGVPEDVETLVVAENAAKWRAGPAHGLDAFLASGRVESSDLTKAWRGLAHALKIDGAAAFDSLLGNRFVFAERPSRADATRPEWIVMSVVSLDTEARIRARLNIAPRRVAAGVSILSLEDGRFWLATSPAAGGNGAVVLLGPAETPGLFDELVGTFGRAQPRNLLGSKQGDDLRRVLPGSEILCFFKRRDEQGRLRLICLGARRAEGSIEFALHARSQPIAEALAPVQESSRAAFDALSRDAYFAAWEWDIPALPALLGIDVPAIDARAIFGVSDAGPLSGERSAYIIADSAEGGLSAAVASVPKVAERASADGDRMMAMLALSVLGPEAQADASLLDFQGLHPGALREISIAGSPASVALRPIVRDDRLVWRMMDAGADGVHWWLAGLGRAGVQRLENALDAGAEADESRQPWVSIGVLRPASLIRKVEGAGLALPPGLVILSTAAGRIEEISWWLRRAEGGSLRGAGTVRLNGFAEPGE